MLSSAVSAQLRDSIPALPPFPGNAMNQQGMIPCWFIIIMIILSAPAV